MFQKYTMTPSPLEHFVQGFLFDGDGTAVAAGEEAVHLGEALLHRRRGTSGPKKRGKKMKFAILKALF